MKIARVTLSDRASAGVYADESGPEIERIAAGHFAEPLEWSRVLLADDRAQIEAALRRLADVEQCPLIINLPGRPRAVAECLPLLMPAIAEAIKLLLGRAGDALHQTRLVDLLDGTQLAIARAKRPDCPVCARLDQLTLSARSGEARDATLWLDAAGLAALGPSARTVFLREPGDPLSAPTGVETVPANDLARLRGLAAAAPLVLACRHGIRSAALARLLRAKHTPGVYAWTDSPP